MCKSQLSGLLFLKKKTFLTWFIILRFSTFLGGPKCFIVTDLFTHAHATTHTHIQPNLQSVYQRSIALPLYHGRPTT